MTQREHMVHPFVGQNALADFQIRRLCEVPWPEDEENGIKPLIVPYDPRCVNPISVDVRLGTFLRKSQKSVLQIQYEKASQYRVPEAIPPTPKELWETRRWEDIDISTNTVDDPFWIYYGEFVLGMTNERYYIPNNLYALFHLKSGRAREGYGHSLAGLCDPGWYGSVLTLELSVHDPHTPLPLYPGLRIGQLTFHPNVAVPTYDYGIVGHYNNDTTVQASKGVFD